jgi:hypothetical protein
MGGTAASLDRVTQKYGSMSTFLWPPTGKEPAMTVAMFVLGLVTFAAMLAFVTVCDRV